MRLSCNEDRCSVVGIQGASNNPNEFMHIIAYNTVQEHTALNAARIRISLLGIELSNPNKVALGMRVVLHYCK